MAQAYSRDELDSMGFTKFQMDRAERHFGNSITTEKAVDYIFANPDDDPQAAAGSGNNANTAVVPYVGSNAAGTGWETAPKPDPDYSAWEANSDDVPQIKSVTNQSEHYERGRTGRTNTPVDSQQPQTSLQPGSTSKDPVDLTQETSMPPLEDADADMEKAIQLSLQEAEGNSNLKPGPDQAGQAASALMMSRQSSRTRQQQEDDEMAQALSMSMVDIQTSGTLLNPEQEEPIESRMRKSADQPVALLASSSAFLSYLPNVFHSFYYNIPFRRAILALQFSYSKKPSYEGYTTEKPAALTRNLLSDTSKNFTVKLAAIQRLFAFMEKSKRAKTALADIIDAFGIEMPKYPSRSPHVEIKLMHDQICHAWLEYNTELASQTLATTPVLTALQRAKSILWCDGVQLNGPEEMQLLTTQGGTPKEQELDNALQKHAICAANVESWVPEVNDTYAALDNWLHAANRAGFIYTPSQSLYIHNSRISRPADNLIGPSLPSSSYSNDTMPTGKPFQIASSIYLDRYDWNQRGETTRLREASFNANAEMTKLAQRRDKLGVYKRTGAPLVSPQLMAADQVIGPEQGPDDKETKKALLEKTIGYLTRASETEEDESRKKSQLRLIEKLTKVTSMLTAEVSRLNKQIQDLHQSNVARWENTRRSIGPYELRSVLYWKGLPGRESTHIYVQSGTSRIEIHGQALEQEKWWRVQEAAVEEVSKDMVLNDSTGMYMPGGGSLVHAYIDKRREEEAAKDIKIVPSLLEAIDADNEVLEAEIAALQSKGNDIQPPSSTAAEASDSSIEIIPTIETVGPSGTTQQGDTDVQMASESQEPTVIESSDPLRLAGGSSSAPAAGRRQRRSSISSDTGSVASTSKVRIGDDEQEEEMEDGSDDEGAQIVELGFAEKMSKKGFKVVKDVGKIGGKPTWLNPALPLETEMITCKICNQTMEFLMQINAPLDELPQAIYRTFYVYTCKKASCVRQNKGGVKVFRVQLPAGNPFYELKETEDQSDLQRFKDRQYSSFCSTCKIPNHEPPCPSVPWKEWLIETGPEELDEDGDEPANPDDIEATMKSATLSNEDGSADAKEPDTKAPVDAAFLKFQERLRDEPDQILRYYYRDTEKQAEPLWVSDESKPESIAPCACGAQRSCEFQILSTILSYIEVDDLQKDSLDFGTIAIYTCQNSCSTAPAPEFKPFEERYAKYAPENGWQEEIAHVQEYSLKGVQFR